VGTAYGIAFTITQNKQPSMPWAGFEPVIQRPRNHVDRPFNKESLKAKTGYAVSYQGWRAQQCLHQSQANEVKGV
jgi:hypothetical protein